MTFLDYGGRGIGYKVWAWLINNKYHNAPFTSERWAHTPYIFSNSLGFGYCDDVAAVTAHIINNLGGEARVWTLNGHIVPEIWANGQWEIYDPDLGIVYIDSASKVMGYESIALYFDEEYFMTNLQLDQVADLRAIVLNHESIDFSFSNGQSKLHGYSNLVRDIYKSVDDNFVADYYLHGVVKNLYPSNLIVPKGATLKIHSTKYLDLQSMYGTPIPEYGIIEITIMPHTEGWLNIPLYMLSISGSGMVSLGDKTYNIPSDEFTAMLESRSIYFQNFYITALTDGLRLNFLVNSTRFRLNRLRRVTVDANSSAFFSIKYGA